MSVVTEQPKRIAVSGAAGHAADAPVVAAQRADELFNEGDLDGVAVWKRILHAIDELQRTKPRTGERVN